jgi:hypothetical protein
MAIGFFMAAFSAAVHKNIEIHSHSIPAFIDFSEIEKT